MADSRPWVVSSFNTPGSSQLAQGSTRTGPATAEAVLASTYPHITDAHYRWRALDTRGLGSSKSEHIPRSLPFMLIVANQLQ